MNRDNDRLDLDSSECHNRDIIKSVHPIFFVRMERTQILPESKG